MITAPYVNAVWLGFTFAVGVIVGMFAHIWSSDKCCDSCEWYLLCKNQEESERW